MHDQSSMRMRKAEALRWIEAQIEERPKDAGLWYGKGILLARVGDLEKALEALDKVLWLDPNHLKALEAKGKALFRMELYLDAYDIFRKLVKKVPRDEEYWYYCGESLVKLENYSKAVPYYDEALDINPNHTDALYGRAHALSRGSGKRAAPEGTGGREFHTVEGEELASVATAEAESKLAKTITMAQTAFYNNDYEEALRLFDEALEADDKNPDVWEAKGRALSNLSRFSEAADCYEKAARRRPRDSSTWLRRGKALRESGQLTEAKASFQKALKLDPDNVEARVESKEVSTEIKVQTRKEIPAQADVTKKAQLSEVPPFATNIDLLDLNMDGGVTPGSVVLITGMPGTFKTSLCFWILFQQCLRKKTKGLFITVEQSKESLLRHITTLGLDPTKAAGDLRVMDLARIRRQLGPEGSRLDWLDILKERIGEIHNTGVQALALDSLEALEALAGFENRRKELHRLFDFLRSLEITSFITAERYELDYDGKLIKTYDVPEYLSDGVLELSWWKRSEGDLQRALRVAKMRDRKHSTSLYFLYWDNGFKLAQALTAPPP